VFEGEMLAEVNMNRAKYSDAPGFAKQRVPIRSCNTPTGRGLRLRNSCDKCARHICQTVAQMHRVGVHCMGSRRDVVRIKYGYTFTLLPIQYSHGTTRSGPLTVYGHAPRGFMSEEELLHNY
jgi:hypothetical protein